MFIGFPGCSVCKKLEIGVGDAKQAIHKTAYLNVYLGNYSLLMYTMFENHTTRAS